MWAHVYLNAPKFTAERTHLDHPRSDHLHVIECQWVIEYPFPQSGKGPKPKEHRPDNTNWKALSIRVVTIWQLGVSHSIFLPWMRSRIHLEAAVNSTACGFLTYRFHVWIPHQWNLQFFFKGVVNRVFLFLFFCEGVVNSDWGIQHKFSCEKSRIQSLPFKTSKSSGSYNFAQNPVENSCTWHTLDEHPIVENYNFFRKNATVQACPKRLLQV